MRQLPQPKTEQDNPFLERRFVDDGHGARMGLLEHLVELRQRVLWAGLGIIIGTSIGAAVATPVLRYLGKPYLSLSGDKAFLIIDPTGSVIAYFRVALLVGASLAIPIITYQLVMFVTPGMTQRERRFFFSALPAVFILFVAGVLFAWFVLIPPALLFLENFQSDLFKADWEAGRYITFVTSLLFWMGVAFETPLVLFIMSLLGFVKAMPLLKHWRVAVVLSAVAAALITPTIDPVNMGLVMGPLLVLYLISIVLVAIGSRFVRRDKRDKRDKVDA